MDIQDIVNIIHTMGRAEVDQVIEAGRMRREYLSRVGIKVGDTVQFDAKTRGIQTGKVIKINPTRTKVQVGMMTWNVSPALLTKVEHKVTA